MAKLLTGETLHGKVQLWYVNQWLVSLATHSSPVSYRLMTYFSLGTTLWCDPVVKRQFLNGTQSWVTLWYASLKLMGDVSIGRLATRNPQVTSPTLLTF